MSTCIAPEDLARVLESAPGSPERQHLDDCVRCRALARSYEAFVTPGQTETTKHELEVARQTLEARLDAEIHGGSPAREPGRVVPLGWRSVLVAAAVLVVVIGVSRWRNADTTPSGTLRGADREQVGVFADMLAAPGDEGWEVQWTPVPDAESYEVQVYSANLDLLATFGPLEDTTLFLSHDLLGQSPNAQASHWRVVALRGGDIVQRSHLGVLP